MEAWKGETSVKVIKTKYKNYNNSKTLHNDIRLALLKLDRKLKWSSTV